MQQSLESPRANKEVVRRAQHTDSFERGARILARSLFRELLASGYQARHIIMVSAELISLLTEALQHLGEGTCEFPGESTRHEAS